MSPILAFLHHLAIFTLVAALVIELVLTKDDIVVKNARRILFADLAFGVSAGVVLVMGLLRVL